MLTVNLNSQMKYSVQPQSHAALRKKEIAAIKHKAVCTCLYMLLNGYLPVH